MGVFHWHTHTYYTELLLSISTLHRSTALLCGPVGGDHGPGAPERQPRRMLCCGEPDLPDAQSATGSLPSSALHLLTLPLSLSATPLSKCGYSKLPWAAFQELGEVEERRSP